MIEDLTVEPNALDTEWFRYSSIYRNAMDEASAIGDELSDKNSYYKYVKGQTYLAYATGRKEITDKDGNAVKKPAGPLISAAVESDEDLYAIQKEIQALEKKHNTAKNYAEGMRQLKYSLQESVKLFLSGYYSEPSVKNVKGGEEYKRNLENIQKTEEKSERRKAWKERRESRKED